MGRPGGGAEPPRSLRSLPPEGAAPRLGAARRRGGAPTLTAFAARRTGGDPHTLLLPHHAHPRRRVDKRSASAVIATPPQISVWRRAEERSVIRRHRYTAAPARLRLTACRHNTTHEAQGGRQGASCDQRSLSASFTPSPAKAAENP
ncbi:MAG: hypothetical protein FHP92_08130 [Denitromonas halophila]|nr:MAG: hypothetical protein FHP92_08130 [Denitromonas halophila]